VSGSLAVDRGLPAGGGLWARPAQVLAVLGSMSVGIFLFSFPTGRFVPRWTGLFVILFVARPFLGVAGLLLLPLALIAVQVYRYRRQSTPVQRQQTKFVLLGIGYVPLIIAVGIHHAFLPVDALAILGFALPALEFALVGAFVVSRQAGNKIWLDDARHRPIN
jgi:hypothetical protein